MPLCGPKLSAFGLILSVWGIVQLGLMGVLFSFNAVALVDDLPDINFPKLGQNLTQFYNDVDQGYHENALNCWIAALIYIITLAISAHQFWANNRSSLSV